MKKSVKKNYIYNLFYQLLLIILPIITTPYVSRILGASGIGTNSYVNSIMTYFLLLGSLGIVMYGQREIAYNQNNIVNRTKTFYEILFFRIITMTISIIIFAIFFMHGNKFSLYYSILSIELFANMFDISWFFQGMEEFKKITIKNIFVKIISILLIFLMVRNSNDLVFYISITSISSVLSSLLLWFDIKKYLCKINLRQLNLKQHIKPVIMLFIPQIAVQIYTILDKTMLGVMLNDMVQVGYYEQSQKIVKMILTIVTSLGTVMIPRISNLNSEGNSEQLNLYLKKVFNFVWFLGCPLMFGIMSTANNMVPWFYGNGYDAVKILLCIFSPIILAIGLNNVIGMQYLISTKKQNIYTFTVIMGALTNVILNLLLIHNFGALGAAISSVASEIVILILQIIIVYKKKYFNIEIIFKNCLKYLLIGFIMFVITFLLGKVLEATILSTVLQIFVGSILYVGILYLIKDEMLISYIDGFINKIFKRSRCK